MLNRSLKSFHLVWSPSKVMRLTLGNPEYSYSSRVMLLFGDVPQGVRKISEDSRSRMWSITHDLAEIFHDLG